MMYEVHVASVGHLKARSLALADGSKGSPRDGDPKEDQSQEDLDLDNFITMDSVGGDGRDAYRLGQKG